MAPHRRLLDGAEAADVLGQAGKRQQIGRLGRGGERERFRDVGEILVAERAFRLPLRAVAKGVGPTAAQPLSAREQPQHGKDPRAELPLGGAAGARVRAGQERRREIDREAPHAGELPGERGAELRLADWLRAQGRPVTLPAGIDALIELQARGGFIGIFRAMSNGDIDAFLTHPRGSISSDGDLIRFGQGFPHPRSYGAFPRVLGRYVRERRLLSLEQAIAKMTSRPAEDLRIAGRGRLAIGAFADIVMFDPATVIDRAAFDDPHRHSEGIVHLLVNGVPVIRDGALTGAMPGRVLRRAGARG